MKVIIAGGTGLIGTALADNLIADKHQVLILTRNVHQKGAAGAELVKWDARTVGDWAEHVEGADAIVNLAGANLDKRWTDDYKQRIKDSRVQAGVTLTEAIKQASTKPKALIQSSAVGYYGNTGDSVLTEESAAGEDFLAGVCQAWEASTADVEGLEVRRAVIRSGIVLAKHGGALARLLPVFRFFAGGAVGKGTQYMPWVHIMDEVNAIRFLIKNKKASGVFNVSAPEPVTNRDFSKTLGKALNRPAIAPAPGIAIKLAFGEMSKIILEGQRAVPEHLLDMGYEFRFSNLETALRHILYSGIKY